VVLLSPREARTCPAASPSGSGRQAVLGEVALDELYGQRAFPDGGRDPFDGPMPGVADNENSRLTGLQRKWLSFEWPTRAGVPIRQEIVASQVEPVFIELKPVGNRFEVGSPPMRMKRASAGISSSVSDESLWITSFSSLRSPMARVTLDLVRIVMRGCCSQRSTRY
jgi:hypothetical protein